MYGDIDAIDAAKKGRSAWDDYVTDYISHYPYTDITLAPLTDLRRAELRSQVLGLAAVLSH